MPQQQNKERLLVFTSDGDKRLDNSALDAATAQLRPGCDVPGGVRLIEGYAGGGAYTIHESEDGGACTTEAPPGMLSATPDAEPTLTVEEGVVEGGAWSTAADTHLLARLLDPVLLMGAGVVLVTLGVAAIIFV